MKLHVAYPTVMIGVAPGLDLALDTHNNLLVYNSETFIAVNLGPLTQQRAREICDYIQRLAIHCPPE